MVCTSDDLRQFEALAARIGREMLRACARGEVFRFEVVLLANSPEAVTSALRAARAMAVSRPPPAAGPPI